MNEEGLREGLPQAADLVGPLEIDLDRVAGRALGRRRRHRAVAGALGLAVAASVGVGLSNWAGSSGQRVVPPSSGAPATPVAGASSGAGGVPAGQTRRYLCGAAIAAPIDPGSRHDTVSVALSAVHRLADGSPQVTYTITSTSTLHVGKNPGRPRVVVLKDGRIVAGQDLAAGASHPPVSGKNLETVTIDPAHPYTGVLAPPVGAPCGGATWAQLWASGGGYQVAVVVSDWELSTPARTPVYTPGYVNPDPVLVLSVPLGG